MSDGRLAAALFAAAFLIRLVCWMGSAIFGTDGGHYLLMADWMREGRFSDALSLAYHPLYPLLIAITGLGTGNSAASGGLLSALLGAATVLPLFGVVRRVLDRPCAFLTGLLYAFNPTILEVQSDVMTEGAFCFFFVSSVWLTWRLLEEPDLPGGAALGLAAAAAFLTRPEGILAIALGAAWPAAWMLVRREGWRARAGGAAVALLVALLLTYPFLSWIRAQTGTWGLSLRPSVGSASKAAGMLLDGGGWEGGGRNLAVQFFKSILRLTYLVTVPFYVLGVVQLSKRRGWPVVFLLSYPLAYFAGILFTLRAHTFMSERYVIPPMILMSAVAALGLTTAIRWASARWGSSPLFPRLAGAAIVVVAVLPCIKTLAPSRWECRGYAAAAAWIGAQGRPARVISGPPQQIAYLSGARSVYSAQTPEDLLVQIDRDRVDYYVYAEKDLEKRAGFVGMLRSCSRLEAPVEIPGPPGAWKVYIHRTK